MDQQNQQQPRRPSLLETRERLAFAIVLIFVIVCLGTMFFPNAGGVQQIITLDANMLGMVIGFYFRRGERG